MTSVLSDRWTPLRYHSEQQKVFNELARFITVVAGRRSGKTEVLKRKLVLKALESIRDASWKDPRFLCGAPTRQQAKAIFWQDLLDLFGSQLIE